MVRGDWKQAHGRAVFTSHPAQQDEKGLYQLEISDEQAGDRKAFLSKQAQGTGCAESHERFIIACLEEHVPKPLFL